MLNPTLSTDTEELYTIGFEKIACHYGKKFTFELKCKIMGQQTREFAKMIIEGLDLPLTVDEFIVESREIFNELFPNCKVLPGENNFNFQVSIHPNDKMDGIFIVFLSF